MAKGNLKAKRKKVAKGNLTRASIKSLRQRINTKREKVPKGNLNLQNALFLESLFNHFKKATKYLLIALWFARSF